MLISLIDLQLQSFKALGRASSSNILAATQKLWEKRPLMFKFITNPTSEGHILGLHAEMLEAEVLEQRRKFPE
jgi:hypothetical protein